jgi:hypothetical protein
MLFGRVSFKKTVSENGHSLYRKSLKGCGPVDGKRIARLGDEAGLGLHLESYRFALLVATLDFELSHKVIC